MTTPVIQRPRWGSGNNRHSCQSVRPSRVIHQTPRDVYGPYHLLRSLPTSSARMETLRASGRPPARKMRASSWLQHCRGNRVRPTLAILNALCLWEKGGKLRQRCLYRALLLISILSQRQQYILTGIWRHYSGFVGLIPILLIPFAPTSGEY
jgi:hypothetical protein